MTINKIVAVDLFSGCGGTSAGLIKAGIEIKAAVEINIRAVETYKKNIDSFVFENDIKDVNGKEILDQIDLQSNEDLLLVACPPCQGFSSIGNGNEGDERNQLVFQFIRLIKEMSPSYILMENVSGMSKGKGKKIFSKVLNQLKEIGYEVEFDILNAADFGVPQLRKRLVLHGVRQDIYRKMQYKGIQLGLPVPTHTNPVKRKGSNDLNAWITTKSIFDLPPIKAGESYKSESIFNHISNGLSELNIKRIQYIRNHGGDRSSLPSELVLECHKKGTGHGDVYGIIDLDKPAPTITGGCMTFSKGRFGHPFQDRALSAREAARLQSFDDEYVFIGNRTEIAKQIGNAVPVKLAEASGNYFQELIQSID